MVYKGNVEHPNFSDWVAIELDKDYAFSWAANPLEIRSSIAVGETWVKFKDKDNLSLGDIHIKYHSDGDIQAYFKAAYPCEGFESEWKDPGKTEIPEVANKRWWLKQVPRNEGSGFSVKCNEELISTYLLSDDFQSGNPTLCPAFLNGDVRFITFVAKPQSAGEYFRDNGEKQFKVIDFLENFEFVRTLF